MICHFNVISFVVLLLHFLSKVNGTAEFAYEKGMRWCDTFCLCPQDSDEKLRCMEPSDIYSILNFSAIQVMRLNRVAWNPIASLKWCDSGRCFCNKETDKLFACIEVNSVLGTFIDDASQSLSLQQTDNHTTESPNVRMAGGGLFLGTAASEDPTEDTGMQEEDSSHRRRDSEEDRRNRRRNRKNRKNRKRNRNDEDVEEESFGQDSLLPTDDSESFDYPETNMLPKQEAINSSPMVTARQPPTRRQPIITPTTQASNIHHNDHNQIDRNQNDRMHNGRHNSNPDEDVFDPLVQESSHQDMRHQSTVNLDDAPQESEPIMEVPVQRKTVAGRVSEDLQQITEDVQHIRSDVVFNQRILLVTVGVAGVAMLGVVVLALHACCSRRSSSRHARITENGRHDDASSHLHHPSSTVTKVNINEAW